MFSVWSIKSAEQITCFLKHILKVYADSYTQARIAERWAQTALQLGLSCSSRHYAGRSLQVFRALNVPINSRMLSDILSRLVETVAEQGEDMQVPTNIFLILLHLSLYNIFYLGLRHWTLAHAWGSRGQPGLRFPTTRRHEGYIQEYAKSKQQRRSDRSGRLQKITNQYCTIGTQSYDERGWTHAKHQLFSFVLHAKSIQFSNRKTR